jgi:pSer/pThr/pTyr-binding forkhead associated (FHA) protein
MLTVKEGTQRGRKFVLDRSAHWVIGRMDDCSVKLSGGIEYQLISRHHAALDVEPRAVLVRDLGSLNGTYVNGKLVGRRHQGLVPEDGTEVLDPGQPLADGDELRLGPVTFDVRVEVPATSPQNN